MCIRSGSIDVIRRSDSTTINETLREATGRAQRTNHQISTTSSLLGYGRLEILFPMNSLAHGTPLPSASSNHRTCTINSLDSSNSHRSLDCQTLNGVAHFRSTPHNLAMQAQTSPQIVAASMCESSQNGWRPSTTYRLCAASAVLKNESREVRCGACTNCSTKAATACMREIDVL